MSSKITPEWHSFEQDYYITKTSSIQENTEWVKKHFKLKEKSSDDDTTYNAFGEIDFRGYGKNTAKYIAVGYETERYDMVKFMLDVWALKRPKLVIKVSGGDLTDSSSIKYTNKQLVEKITEGIIKAAKISGAWIITDGTHTGVSKLVGEAVRDCRLASGLPNPVVAIGIAQWDSIQNRDSLICRNNDTLISKRPYQLDKKPNPYTHYLDPYHSHFILLDDRSEMRFGTKRQFEFRAQLENDLAHLAQSEMRIDQKPIVLIVFGGDSKTIKNVVEAIQNAIRIITVRGSGGVADIIADAVSNPYLYDNLVDVPRVRTTKYGKSTFCYEAAQVWNSLPNNLRKVDDFKEFGRLISTWSGPSCKCSMCKT